MDCGRHRVFLALLVLCMGASVHGLFYEPTAEDLKKRSDIENSIKEPGVFSWGLSCASKTIGYFTPHAAKSGLDHIGALGISFASHIEFARNGLKHLFYGPDNRLFSQYDDIIGVHTTIPEQGIPLNVINGLINQASQERTVWGLGHMSGAVYDGSIEHSDVLADFFSAALDRDLVNQALFAHSPSAKSIAVEAFRHFQTSNPLHGSSFPLAVKAMRELGLMLANLTNKKDAVVSSSGQEGLRLGLRALKNSFSCSPKNPCTFLAIDDEDRIASANHTLNINTKLSTHNNLDKIYTHVDAAVLFLSPKNIGQLSNIVNDISNNDWKLHIHLDRHAFYELISGGSTSELSRIFTLSPAIVSLSMDTDGLIYNGASATIFKNSDLRYQALEVYLDWQGGLYPALNSAGSISGVDYIIAYLLTVHKGIEGMIRVHNNFSYTPHHMPPSSSSKDNGTDHNVATTFATKTDRETIKSLLGKLNPKDALISLHLSMFNAPPKDYSGIMSSGGTESIRLAVQAYSDRFVTEFRGQTPIFLMSKTAHIAFRRQAQDIDAIIIEVNNGPHKSMDVQDLRRKIEEHGGANKIAAIIASTPAYVEGAYDDVKAIAKVAFEANIPLHADACLSAFVNQFINENPIKIDFQNPDYMGLTSWSADTHKYGTTHKGVSFLGYKKSAFNHAPQEMCQTRSRTHLEVGLACMLLIGEAGYKERAKNINGLAQKLRSQLEQIPELEIIAKPQEDRIPHFVIAFRLKDKLKTHTYTLASFLKKLGWHLSQVSDYTLHIAITNAHVHNQQFLAQFMSDVQFVINVLAAHPNLKPSSSVGVYGMAANINGVSGHLTQQQLLQLLLKLYAENLLGL